MKPVRPLSTLVALLVLCLTTAAVATGRAAGQQTDVEARIAALEAGQKAMQKELQEIKAILQGRPSVPSQIAAPPSPARLPAAPLSLDGASRGNANAKLVLLEYSDFECPFCGRHTRETAPQIEREYVATGKVRQVFRHYPIEQIHPHAFKAAQTAECARQQGKFWEMHARLFANQAALADANLLAHAKALGLDAASFQRCVTAPATTAKIRLDLADGAREQITGTPAFFVGTVDKDGKLKVLRRINGAAAYSSFKQTFDALLASQ